MVKYSYSSSTNIHCIHTANKNINGHYYNDSQYCKVEEVMSSSSSTSTLTICLIYNFLAHVFLCCLQLKFVCLIVYNFFFLIFWFFSRKKTCSLCSCVCVYIQSSPSTPPNWTTTTKKKQESFACTGVPNHCYSPSIIIIIIII